MPRRTRSLRSPSGSRRSTPGSHRPRLCTALAHPEFGADVMHVLRVFDRFTTSLDPSLSRIKYWFEPEIVKGPRGEFQLGDLFTSYVATRNHAANIAAPDHPGISTEQLTIEHLNAGQCLGVLSSVGSHATLVTRVKRRFEEIGTPLGEVGRSDVTSGAVSVSLTVLALPSLETRPSGKPSCMKVGGALTLTEEWASILHSRANFAICSVVRRSAHYRPRCPVNRINSSFAMTGCRDLHSATHPTRRRDVGQRHFRVVRRTYGVDLSGADPRLVERVGGNVITFDLIRLIVLGRDIGGAQPGNQSRTAASAFTSARPAAGMTLFPSGRDGSHLRVGPAVFRSRPVVRGHVVASHEVPHRSVANNRRTPFCPLH